MPDLPALTDLDREFAAAIGESPQEMQGRILAVMNAKLLRGKRSERDRHNRRVNSDLEFEKPTSEVIAELVEPEIIYIPESYVIFIRHWTCTGCGDSGTCADYPGLFLCSRPYKRGKDESNARQYSPVKCIEHANLPRRLEAVVRSQFICETCFEDLVPIPGFASAGPGVAVLADLMNQMQEGEKNHG